MLARDHERRRRRGPDRRLPDRAAHEGRDGRRARPGSRARCASWRVPVDGRRRRPARHGRHRRRRRRPSTSRRPPRSWPPAPGCRVAKHGNRSATSLCGSADLLEALGARIDLEPGGGRASASTRSASGSCSRRAHHQATRHVVPVRKALGVRTIFNFLGPLTNPAGATRQLIGVVRPRLPGADRRRARAARLRGARWSCRATDGMDEVSVCARDARCSR